MTGRLEEQTGELVTANAQLDTRRAFTEAVLSGVTAGVISVERATIRLINSSAEALLKTGGKARSGRSSPISRPSSTASSPRRGARGRRPARRAASRGRWR